MPRDKQDEAERKARLAQALRQNLRKRKAQERARDAGSAGPRQDDHPQGEGGQDA